MRSVEVYLAGNIVYVSGTVNGIAYTWTLTGDHVWSAEVNRSADDVYAIELQAINSAGAVQDLSTVIYYGLHLATDRTGGFYNAEDLNRVEAAAKYLSDQFDNLPTVLADYLVSLNVAQDKFFEVPYEHPLGLVTMTSWTENDIPNHGDMARYLGNVAVLKEALPLENSPALPSSVEKLTVDGANNIEKVLRIVNDATLALEALTKHYADNTAAIFVYSGEVYSGEV